MFLLPIRFLKALTSLSLLSHFRCQWVNSSLLSWIFFFNLVLACFRSAISIFCLSRSLCSLAISVEVCMVLWLDTFSRRSFNSSTCPFSFFMILCKLDFSVSKRSRLPHSSAFSACNLSIYKIKYVKNSWKKITSNQLFSSSVENTQRTRKF